MNNYLKFRVSSAKPTISSSNENITPIKQEILSLDMTMTESDYKNINRLHKIVFIYKHKYGEIKNIILSQDVYLSVFKYMYHTTDGGIYYDYFEDIPITLIRGRMTEFIKILFGDNQTEFMEVLKDMR